MKVDLTDLSAVKKRMTIEVPPEEVERETQGVLRSYARKAKIPGFRPGKTPLELIRKRFGPEVDEDVRDRIVTRSFKQAAEERGLKPVGDPSLEDVSCEQGQSLSFKTTFEVIPEFEVRGYREVEVRRPADQIKDEDVDKALEELREARVRHIYEAARAAAQGDLVVVDLEGEPLEGEPFKRERTPIEVGAANNLAEFNDKLLGATEGTELEFPVEYPAEFRAEELAGKRVHFRLKVHEVKRRELPELDDEFAKDLGGSFETLGDLRDQVRRDLEARKKHDADQAVRGALVDKVLLENTVMLPEALVEREVRRRLEDVARGLILQGVDLEKTELDWNEMRKRQEEPARKAVHARLVLDAIAEAERIQVDRRDVDQRIRLEARRAGESAEALRTRLQKQGGVEALRSQLLREKTLDYLTTVANIHPEE